ncbi:hypothetical protein DXA60_08270 [Roseburia sp. OF03-24]|nr:hypothetical protein DXA60_08270 [Roseburia sp. OF03-24]
MLEVALQVQTITQKHGCPEGCHAFFIHRKLRPMNEKALRAGCAPRGEEVCCKQHRPGAKEAQVLLFTRTSFQ